MPISTSTMVDISLVAQRLKSHLYVFSNALQVALDTNCDHQRAVQMWTSSFTEPCIACPCQSYADLLSEQCDNCISQNTVGYWSIKKSEQPTTYYIRTTDKRPYCKYGPQLFSTFVTSVHPSLCVHPSSIKRDCQVNIFFTVDKTTMIKLNFLVIATKVSILDSWQM